MLFSARHELDEDELAACFQKVRNAIRRAESDGIASEILTFALMSEALPRIVRNHGPAWAAEVFTKLAHRIGAGLV